MEVSSAGLDLGQTIELFCFTKPARSASDVLNSILLLVSLTPHLILLEILVDKAYTS